MARLLSFLASGLLIIASIDAKPFTNTKERFKCVKLNGEIELGPQHYECWSNGESICGQIPLFSHEIDLCKECCQDPTKGNIKIKGPKSQPEEPEKGKLQKYSQQGLVSRGWKDSTIAVSVVSILIIVCLVGAILNMKKNITSRTQAIHHPTADTKEENMEMLTTPPSCQPQREYGGLPEGSV